MELNQVKAVITGGVSGLGYAVAHHIVAHGGAVALLDVNDEKGAQAVAALGGNTHFFRTDVTSEVSARPGKRWADSTPRSTAPASSVPDACSARKRRCR
jgi:NAD(P)-dependent dehydrogenase (short-subunit alcohol dehydrogenase family)